MHYLKPNSKQPLFASVQKSTIPDIVPSSSIDAADEQIQNLGKQSESRINNNIAHDVRVDTMIKEQLDNSFSVYGNKSKVENKINKSKSLVTLASKGLKPTMSSQQILEKRFKQSKQEVSNQIAGLEKQCDKFGGHIYIRNQMDKQQITPEELYKFYKERITSIHGSLTLPKLNTRQQPNPTIGQHKSAKTSPSSSSLKYNKWYIQPSKRFTIQQLNQQQNMKRVTQYIDKILKDKRDKVTIRQQYAPIIVKQSARRLGRNPVICSYAEISRR